jgi:hypothetical protein
MVEEGSRWKREKEGEGWRRSRKARVADQTAGMAERASTASSICLSDPQGRDEVVAQGAQNSVKESPFWDPSIEGERAREPCAHPSLTRRSPWLTLQGASV